MYYRVRVEDTIRIPPNKFSEDLDEVVTNIVQKTFEGTMRKQHGIIVVADNIEHVDWLQLSGCGKVQLCKVRIAIELTGGQRLDHSVCGFAHG